MELSRRSLIKTTLAASAAVAAGLSTKEASAQAQPVDKWVKGVCRMCGTGCSLYTGVKDGKLVAIRGNTDSKTNTNGILCVKGANIWKVANHPDRLTTPLIRGKDGKFQKATWDEALTLIETKFKEYHKKFGYDSVAYYGSGQCTTEESYTFNKLWKGGFGSNMMDGNPRLCMASAVGAFIGSLGSDEPAGTYEDIENAKCIFLTGSNTADAHPILFNRISRHKRNNPDVKIIVCEPRKTVTSRIADLWMPFRPGTDLYVFNGMAREIIKKGMVDKEFMKLLRYTKGPGTEEIKYEDYVASLEKYTPEYVEKMSGCPAESVVEAANMFAKSGATLSMWCMGLNQRSNGVWANNLIHNLHGLTGNYGKPGADAFSLTGQPNACGGVRETGSLTHLLPGARPVANEKWRTFVSNYWKVAENCINPTKAINPKPGFHAVKMFGSLGAENDANKPLKAVIISTTNPAQTLPNINKYIPNIKAAFTVVIDIFPTRTAQLASVILPAAFLYEKGGVYGCSERRSFLTEKAVDAPGQAMPDIWIASQIANRMGLSKLITWSNEKDVMKMNEMAWNDYIGCTANTEKTLKGATYDRLKKSTTGVQWPCPDVNHPGTYKRYVRGMDPIFDDPKRYGYTIPADAKQYFYAKPDGRMNVFIRDAEPKLSEAITKEYPFFLTTGRILEQWHCGSMTMRIPETAQAHPNDYVMIHKNDAQRLSIKEGDMVKVESVRGEGTFPARLVDMSLEGIVYIPMHDQRASRMVNYITSDVVDPGSFEPDYKVSAVKLTRVSGPKNVAEKYIIDMDELNKPTFS